MFMLLFFKNLEGNDNFGISLRLLLRIHKNIFLRTIAMFYNDYRNLEITTIFNDYKNPEILERSICDI